MSDTQEVHDLFRGAGEVSKWLRVAALSGEIAAAGIALHAILLKGSDVAIARPLLAFGLALGTWALREYATHVDQFAERCRRISIRAYANGDSVSPGRCSTLRSAAPVGATALALRLPATALEDYYEPSMPVGEERLRELYAHSSFYTWRLLRATAWLYGIGAGAVFGIALVVLYQLAASDTPPLPRPLALEAIFSVLLAVLGLRGLSLMAACAFGASGAKKVAEGLIADPLPTGPRLLELADAYDFERMGAPSPPTILYKMNRDRLAEDWAHRRRALSGVTP